MYSESCKHGSEGGLCRPTIEIWQGGTFLPYNFIVAIMYSQLFNLLCDRADDVHGGRLPYHVRLLLDEFSNIGQIPKFDKLIATIRSREISASIILQSQSQLKTIYKDAAETILGNCVRPEAASAL